jgi:hypothetical protein
MAQVVQPEVLQASNYQYAVDIANGASDRAATIRGLVIRQEDYRSALVWSGKSLSETASPSTPSQRPPLQSLHHEQAMPLLSQHSNTFSRHNELQIS